MGVSSSEQEKASCHDEQGLGFLELTYIAVQLAKTIDWLKWYKMGRSSLWRKISLVTWKLFLLTIGDQVNNSSYFRCNLFVSDMFPLLLGSVWLSKFRKKYA